MPNVSNVGLFGFWADALRKEAVMPVSRQPLSSPPSPAMRRFLTRAEAAILIGMVMVIFSLFLLWVRKKPDISPAFLGASLHIGSLTISHDGFGAGVAAPLTICAALCACTLLWDITAKNRLALTAAGVAGGLACLIIALVHFALLPGVLVGMVGGVLLLFGALDRYTRAPVEPN